MSEPRGLDRSRYFRRAFGTGLPACFVALLILGGGTPSALGDVALGLGVGLVVGLWAMATSWRDG